MIEVFDEKDVEECLSEVKDSNIKTYAFCLLDWAVQKRKVQAIPLDKVKKAREEMKECSYSLSSFSEDVFDEDERVVDLDDVLIILDKLIESEG